MSDVLTQEIAPAVPLTIDGKTYSLAFPTSAVFALHNKTKVNLFNVKSWSRIDEDPACLVATLWAALQANHAAEFKDVKDAEKLVNMRTFIPVVDAIGKTLIAHLPKPEPGVADPNAQAAESQEK